MRLIGVLAASQLSLSFAARDSWTCSWAGHADLAHTTEVRDAVMGLPLANIVTVPEVREGAFVECATWVSGSTDSPRLRPALERPGANEIRVTRPGYSTWTCRGVRVSRDACSQRHGAVLAVALELLAAK